MLQKSLLQSVMRNLMDSEDDQERSTQRIKLENDLAVTSERLDHLVQGGCGQVWYMSCYHSETCRTQS